MQIKASTAFRLLRALLLAGLAHRELHRSERTGAAVFDSVWRRTSRWPRFLGRHTWRGPRQRHPASGPGAARPGGPRIRSRSDPHPLPHASVPHPGYGGRPLGKPGGGGGRGRPCGQQSSLRPASGGYYEGGPQGTAELLQLLLRAEGEPNGGPDPTGHRVAQRKRFVPSHAGAGVQTASKDCGIGRRHFCRRTSVFRGHASAWALRDASRPSFEDTSSSLDPKAGENRLTGHQMTGCFSEQNQFEMQGTVLLLLLLLSKITLWKTALNIRYEPASAILFKVNLTKNERSGSSFAHL